MIEISIFIDMINLDSKTLLSVLAWVNIVLAGLIYLFRSVNKDAYDKEYVTLLFITRLAQAVSSFLLFSRYYFIDFLSVNIGNTLFLASLYLDSCLLLSLSEAKNKRLYGYVKWLTVFMIIIFNAVEFMFKQPSLRIVLASTTMIIILSIPVFTLLLTKPAILYKRVIGALYLFFVLLLFPRAVMPFLDKNMDILSSSAIQTLTFLSLLLIAVSSTAVFLFIMKGDMDKKIKIMATTDSLTSILNRGCFMDEASLVFNSCKADGKKLSLLFFDLDHFKKVNDDYGHAFGDKVIIFFAEAIKRNLRSCDLLCRYGGEEFLVLLVTDEHNTGSAISHRIMLDIEKAYFEDYPDFKFTTSVGIISGIPKKDEKLEDFIAKSDEALYRAKNAGRNKIVSYD